MTSPPHRCRCRIKTHWDSDVRGHEVTCRQHSPDTVIVRYSQLCDFTARSAVTYPSLPAPPATEAAWSEGWLTWCRLKDYTSLLCIYVRPLVPLAYQLCAPPCSTHLHFSLFLFNSIWHNLVLNSWPLSLEACVCMWAQTEICYKLFNGGKLTLVQIFMVSRGWISVTLISMYFLLALLSG